jgi:hypothetical protein
MKSIQPIQIWINGQNKTASVLDARIINDDLQSSCTFYWELKEASTEETQGQQLAQGNVTMSGDDYLNWDGTNDEAYAYIANQINVVIL